MGALPEWLRLISILLIDGKNEGWRISTGKSCFCGSSRRGSTATRRCLLTARHCRTALSGCVELMGFGFTRYSRGYQQPRPRSTPISNIARKCGRIRTGAQSHSTLEPLAARRAVSYDHHVLGVRVMRYDGLRLRPVRPSDLVAFCWWVGSGCLYVVCRAVAYRVALKSRSPVVYLAQ